MLHEREVYGNGGERRKFFPNGFLRGRRFGNVFHEGGQFRAVLVQLFAHGGNAPDEHAGIPAEIAPAQVGCGRGRVRFFAELNDFTAGTARNGLDFFSAFNVAVGGAGPSRLDPHSDKRFFPGSRVHGGFHQGAERFLVLNELVGGDDEHDSVRIRRLDEADAQGDGGSRVPAHGFGNDVVHGNIVGLAAHFRFLQMVGQDKDVLPGHQPVQPVDGLAEEGSFPEHVQELFGAVVAGEGPETGAAAAGQDKSVLVHVCFAGMGVKKGQSAPKRRFLRE